MIRRLVNFLTALSLVLCLASAAVWARSYRVAESVMWVRWYSVAELPPWHEGSLPRNAEDAELLRRRSVGYFAGSSRGNVMVVIIHSHLVHGGLAVEPGVYYDDAGPYNDWLSGFSTAPFEWWLGMAFVVEDDGVNRVRAVRFPPGSPSPRSPQSPRSAPGAWRAAAVILRRRHGPRRAGFKVK